jgi:hypothetical protein
MKAYDTCGGAASPHIAGYTRHEKAENMSSCIPSGNDLTPSTSLFYRQALLTLGAAEVPFLVGGAYALAHYASIVRHTKDLDIFVRPDDYARTSAALQAAGYDIELTFPHWLGKAFCGEDCIDVIFSSGNGVATVDETWFTHAVTGDMLGLPVHFCPAEEMLWSKSFIMERERYDGADIIHLLLARGRQFDWPRLLGRFGSYWRVLLSHLILFGFVYPGAQSCLPTWVMQELLRRLQHEMHYPPPDNQLCQGTLLSRAQYQTAIECWEYQDARLVPHGNMTAEAIAHWTAAFLQEETTHEHREGSRPSGSHR